MSIWPNGVQIGNTGPTGAYGVVLEGWAEAQTFTDTTVTNALKFLEGILSVSDNLANIPQMSVTLGALTKEVEAFVKPVEPTMLEFDTNFPTMQTDVVLTDVSLMEIPTEPTFSGTLPTEDFIYAEAAYASGLLDVVNSKLTELVSGMATGISEAVEQQLWDRAKQRTSLTTRRLKAQNERYWASSGWDIPGGELRDKNYEAEQEAVNADIAESREIAIKQADLEQKNRQFAMKTAVILEQIMVQHFDQVALRALDAAKYVIEAGQKLYGLQLDGYGKQIDAFRGIIEGRKAIQDAQIKIYQEVPLEAFKTKAQAVNTLVEAEAKRITSLTETNKVRSDVFKTLTEAETAKIEGQTKAQEQEVKYLTAKASAEIEVMKGNVSTLLAQAEMLIEAMKSGAQVAAQLAAASLSMVNLSASVSDSRSLSNSTSDNTSRSDSTSTSYNYNMNG